MFKLVFSSKAKDDRFKIICWISETPMTWNNNLGSILYVWQKWQGNISQTQKRMIIFFSDFSFSSSLFSLAKNNIKHMRMTLVNTHLTFTHIVSWMIICIYTVFGRYSKVKNTNFMLTLGDFLMMMYTKILKTYLRIAI